MEVLVIRICVREAEGGETTPSFGHPSNVRRAPEAALPLGVSDLPVSLLIGGKGGCIPPNRREGRLYPS
jgi:hypothetical protein